MTTTVSEIKMTKITVNDFISMAEKLAAEWERSVEDINKSGKREYTEPSRAALSPELCSHIRITSAMHVLSQYYTVVP